MRIKARLLTLVAPPAIGGLLIAFYAASSAERAVKEHVERSARVASRSLALELEQTIETAAEEWHGYTSSPEIQNALADSNSAMDTPDRERVIRERDDVWRRADPDDPTIGAVLGSTLSRMLAAQVRSHVTHTGARRYGEVFITNRFGANLAQSGMTSDYYQGDEEWWRNAMNQGIVVGDIAYDDSANMYSFDLSLRIDDVNGNPAGVIKAVASIDPVINLLSDRAELLRESAATDIVLLTSDGRTIYSTGQPDLPLLETSHAEYLTALDDHRSGHTQVYEDEDHAEGYSSVSLPEDTPLTGWRLLIEWNSRQLFAATDAMRAQILTIAGALTLIAALIAVLFGSSMSRRLADLASAAKAYGRGEREPYTPDEYRDEIGVLSRSFARMRDSIDESERTLQEDRRLLEAVLSAIPFQVYWKNTDLEFTGCNQAFAQWMGCSSPEELIGRGESEIRGVSEDSTEMAIEDARVFASGLTILHDEREVKKADGTTANLEVSKMPIRDSKGCVIGLLGGFIDITRRKNLESQLSQAQKLESIGQLAAGIAHEINTPAQYVGDNTRFLRDEFKNIVDVLDKYSSHLDTSGPQLSWSERAEEVRNTLENVGYEFLRDEIPKALEQSLDGIERITHIVSAMKNFSHPGSTDKELANLNKAIESTVTVCSNRWKYVADLELDLDPTLPAVPCLLGEFNQVVLNLIVNAADAIESKHDGADAKGSIVVRTKREGDHAVIQVSDTGGGIPENVLSKIYDPFFTTKEVGKGTGQGLAISQDVIVNKHDGKLDCDVEPGVGTTFTIKLPLTAMEHAEAAA